MKKLTKTIVLLLLTTQVLFAQSNEQQAQKKTQEAIKLMDGGQVKESLVLLTEAQSLDPNNIEIPYEIALANYLLKDYKSSIKILEDLTRHKNVFDRVYQMLGNSYDMNEDTKKAISAYEKGLKKFPQSGNLYLEMGVMQLKKDDTNAALSYFEKGIEMAPEHPSNYYWASKIFCQSTEELWGMLYGEIFMNLERNSKRTEEISKLLFDTYKSQIKFTSDTSYSVSFSKNATITLSDLTNFKLPYGIAVYEPTLTLSLLTEKQIDLASLNRVRTNFVQMYYKNEHHKKYPNVLFDFQKTLLEVGYLEAYNYWILSMGDEEGFTTWVNANKDKWDSFVKWFTDNTLQVDASHRFHRTLY